MLHTNRTHQLDQRPRTRRDFNHQPTLQLGSDAFQPDDNLILASLSAHLLASQLSVVR